MAVRWHSSRKCDVCRRDCQDVLYDAKTIHGMWATLCQIHYDKIGVGLGTGLGQKYQMQSDGHFMKVEG